MQHLDDETKPIVGGRVPCNKGEKSKKWIDRNSLNNREEVGELSRHSSS